MTFLFFDNLLDTGSFLVGVFWKKVLDYYSGICFFKYFPNWWSLAKNLHSKPKMIGTLGGPLCLDDRRKKPSSHRYGSKIRHGQKFSSVKSLIFGCFRYGAIFGYFSVFIMVLPHIIFSWSVGYDKKFCFIGRGSRLRRPNCSIVFRKNIFLGCFMYFYGSATPDSSETRPFGQRVRHKIFRTQIGTREKLSPKFKAVYF